MEGWHDLFVATGGSAAALTGLIFVGVSINLNKILSIPHLPDRALLTLVFLMTILVMSILFLIPGQPLSTLGAEVLFFGLISWFSVTALDVLIYRKTSLTYKRLYHFHLIANQLGILPYIIAGMLLVLSQGSGVYWVVPAIILCFIKSIWDSWVLLVEINR
jgi:modulator of FtsH protease